MVKLKQFVGKLPTYCLNAFGHFVGSTFKGLSMKGSKEIFAAAALAQGSSESDLHDLIFDQCSYSDDFITSSFRKIAPEENCSPTLTQTLTLTGGYFPLGQLSGHHYKHVRPNFPLLYTTGSWYIKLHAFGLRTNYTVKNY